MSRRNRRRPRPCVSRHRTASQVAPSRSPPGTSDTARSSCRCRSRRAETSPSAAHARRIAITSACAVGSLVGGDQVRSFGDDPGVPHHHRAEGSAATGPYVLDCQVDRSPHELFLWAHSTRYYPITRAAAASCSAASLARAPGRPHESPPPARSGNNCASVFSANSVPGIVERRHQHEAVGDVEVRIAGRQPLPVELDRLGHRQLDDAQRACHPGLSSTAAAASSPASAHSCPPPDPLRRR